MSDGSGGSGDDTQLDSFASPVGTDGPAGASGGEPAYDTGDWCTREDLANWLAAGSTAIEDIDSLFSIISLRRKGSRATKVALLLDAFDEYPNLVRLGFACHSRANHRDAHLLEGITDNNRKTSKVNGDGVLSDDLGYDASTGSFSRPEVRGSLPATNRDGSNSAVSPARRGGASRAGSDTVSLSKREWEAMQSRMAAIEAGSAGGAGDGASGVTRAEILAMVEQGKREAREELLRDIKEGREVVDTWASKADRRKASAFEVCPDFAVFSFDHESDRSNTVNLFDDSDVTGSFRRLVYFNSIRDDDRRKIMRRTALPAGWSDPPTITPRNLHQFSAAQLAKDKELRDQQTKLLPSFQITANVLDLACRSHAECEHLRDDLANSRPIEDRVDAIQDGLDDIIFALSDNFHVLAQPISGIQRERNNLSLQAKSRTGSATVPELAPPDDGQWHHDEGDISIGSETISMDVYAARLRKAEKERNDLAGQQRRRPGGPGPKPKKSKNKRNKPAAAPAAAPAPSPAPAPAPTPAVASAGAAASAKPKAKN